ncbi:MAG: O-antigen ligase family protein [Flavobacteriaceae bacterium]|nr:O-antigen ligase family protein [Flavobacteriaceae bacterium]
MRLAQKILIPLFIIVSHLAMNETSVLLRGVFYLLVIILSCLAIVELRKNKGKVKIAIPEILLLSYILYLILNNLFRSTFFTNHDLHNYLTLFLLYYVFKISYKNDNEILKYIFYGFYTTFSIELIIGFSQFLGLFSNVDSKFIIGGLFGNPGAFAGYLAIFAPYLMVAIFYNKQLFKSENFQYTTIFFLFCSTIMIIVSNSRGAWVAFILGVGYILYEKYEIGNYLSEKLKSATTKILTSTILFFTIIFISIVLYNYKPQSAFGRLFIWKVSKTMAMEKPLFGKGFGSFEADYSKVQANYFLNNKGTSNEIQVADYVTVAYNEFLEMFIESGVIGLLLFVSILYFALGKKYNSKTSKHHISAKASLVSLLALSMVSYPFRLMPNILLLVVCLFIIFNTGQYKTISIALKLRKGLFLLWFIAISGLIFLGGRHVLGTYYFKKGYAKVLNQDFDSGITNYKKAHVYLGNNGNFIFYYGAALYLNQNYSKSIPYLQRAVDLRSDPNAFITLGNSFKALNRYDKAEKAYQTAANIIPSRIYPKYLLANLYVKMQQPDKALNMAKTILNSKEKVPTTAGDEIKIEMKLLIKKYSK